MSQGGFTFSFPCLDRALKMVTEDDARKFPMVSGEGKKVCGYRF